MGSANFLFIHGLLAKDIFDISNWLQKKNIHVMWKLYEIQYP